MFATYAMGLDVKAVSCSCDAKNSFTTVNGLIDIDSLGINPEVIRDLSSAWSCEREQLFSGGAAVMLSERISWQR